MAIDIIEKLKDIATSLFATVLRFSAADDGAFRLLITSDVDGVPKPLLLVGTAHSRIEDGNCIAILNPDEGVLQTIIAGCGYNEALLKELIGGKCDAMVLLWIELYVKETTSVIGKYNAREHKPAKFSVR